MKNEVRNRSEQLSVDELNLIKEEFRRDKEKWTDLLLQRTFWHQDLQLRVLDREFNFTLMLSSVSVAFMTIAIPFLRQSVPDLISRTSIIAFFASSVLGVISIIWSIEWDKKELPRYAEWELDFFSKPQRAAAQIYFKAFEGSVTKADIKSYFEIKNVADEEANARAEVRKKSFNKKALLVLDKLVLVAFMIGLVSLFGNLLTVL